MGEIVPRNQLARQAMVGIGAAVGGILLIALAGNPVFGIVVGIVLLVAGIALGTGKTDRAVGIGMAVVGAAAVVAGILRGKDAVSVVMRIVGILALAGGVFQLIRFFLALKKRS